MAQPNPFQNVLTNLNVNGKTYRYYALPALQDARLERLPYSIRILLEAAVRNCDNFEVKKTDVETILGWEKTVMEDKEIPFKPARVLLQDFTGVPCVVDLAAMRDAMKRLGGEAEKINPLVPVDLVIDHSVQVDRARSPNAREFNEEREFQRNAERFRFLKWGQKAFKNMTIVPPGSGIVHQVNLEYLARLVFDVDGLLYPDSVVGTDSHTTMIDGLGVCGWGVGGIEAEAVMLGQATVMVLPQVVGYELTGKLDPMITSTDLVLTITQNLRKHGVVGKFVEFYGPGVQSLSIADRATLANMSPEYGATMGFFPVDNRTLDYLRQTSRSDEHVKVIEAYLRAQGLFVDYKEKKPTPTYCSTLSLDLGTVVPCLAGPKRPHDRVPLADMKKDFVACLGAKVGFKGFDIPKEKQGTTTPFKFDGEEFKLAHGNLVIAAITSCTNTSNPSVMLGAGLVAKKAVEKGLSVKKYIKTSLSPGSGVVTKYLASSGLQAYLDQLGFSLAGYGCMTCIGNSGEIAEPVVKAIGEGDLVVSAVLSGNRNFEGRVHALTRANYLASPPLVVAFALAGTVAIDFETDPIGMDQNGKPVFLKDIWPTRDEIAEFESKHVLPAMFKEVYERVQHGTDRWNALDAPSGFLYTWEKESTYIHNPPFFSKMGLEVDPVRPIKDAYALLNLGDSITTDHISPAGAIGKTSPAAKYLTARGVKPEDFNTYGSRRGNDEIMARGTFANVRLVNKFMNRATPQTLHIPTGDVLPVWEVAERYMQANQDTIILAGGEYGSGSSRDWAAKGPFLQGVRAVIATSYERIHRSNLVGMSVLPLQFKAGETADSLKLTGKEQFSIDIPEHLHHGQDLIVKVSNGREFSVTCRLDTEVEVAYYKHGGILQFVLRKLLKEPKE